MNSIKELAVEGALWAMGVCNSNCCRGSIEIPIWATWEMGCTPNGPWILGSGNKKAREIKNHNC